MTDFRWKWWKCQRFMDENWIADYTLTEMNECPMTTTPLHTHPLRGTISCNQQWHLRSYLWLNEKNYCSTWLHLKVGQPRRRPHGSTWARPEKADPGSGTRSGFRDRTDPDELNWTSSDKHIEDSRRGREGKKRARGGYAGMKMTPFMTWKLI